MRKKKKMNAAGSDITARVMADLNELCVVDYVEIGDDDVFLDQLQPNDIYSDIETTRPPRTVTEARQALAGGEHRRRRTSDVIDSLGEEIVLRHGPGTEPYGIPVSPRNRISSDLGYCESYASSPGNTPRGTTFTDSRPMSYDPNASCTEIKEAIMPVARDANSYNMGHPRRGRAVIFNNDLFENNMASPRKGSHVDVGCLKETFSHLGFDVTTFHNLTHHQIKETVFNLSKEDHSDADCILIAVLSHGLDNGLLYARDALYRVESLWVPFTADNCTSLAGKPKLFFVQACRGDRLDGGVSMVSQRRSMSETDSGNQSYKIPTHCDFLFSYSSMDGFYSWRNPEEGTWFIQSLGQLLKEHGDKLNIHDVLTLVQRKVCLYYESNVEGTPWMNNQKQCPVYSSTLMRDLIFVQKPQL